MDTIEIERLHLPCIIGCLEHERHNKQHVTINLRLGIDAREAGRTDEVRHALDYVQVRDRVAAHVESSSYRLVEALATAIARICVVECGALWVQVRLHKTGVLANTDSVGVVIERTPKDFQ